MATVAILFKVYAEENSLDSVVSEIRSKLNPAGIQKEDVAFGIKVIKVLFKFDDKQTTSSKIEESLRKIEGVRELEVEEESLI